MDATRHGLMSHGAFQEPRQFRVDIIFFFFDFLAAFSVCLLRHKRNARSHRSLFAFCNSNFLENNTTAQQTVSPKLAQMKSLILKVNQINGS